MKFFPQKVRATASAKKKSSWREWTDARIFAVVAATLIRGRHTLED